MFYRTKVTFIVLSDKPIPAWMDMSAIVTECETGEFVADYNVETPDKNEELTGKQMADALYAAGSDPGFFNIDDNGNPTGD